MESVAPWRVSRAMPIIEGESLDGYVARIAAAHHFPRMAELTQLAGAEATGRQHASFCSKEGLDVLADCLRVDPAQLHHHSPNWSLGAAALNMFGVEVPRDLLHFAYRRYSPASLGNSAHHRALWNVRIFPFCEESWEYLLDRCPNPSCNHRLEWRRTLGVDLCDLCGEPLVRGQATRVPEEYRAQLRGLVGLIHPDPARREASRSQLPPRLAGMESADLLELACALATVVDHRTARPLGRQTATLGEPAKLIVAALAQTWPLLCGWPSAFEALLAGRINAHAKQRGDGNGGASHRLLSRARVSSLSPAPQALLCDFIEECRAARDRGLTAHQASKVSGAHLRTLVKMRRAGELPSVLALDGQRLHVLFDREAVEQLARRHTPSKRLVRASANLGIPGYALRELMWLGLIKEAPLPPGRKGKHTVDEASLAQFTRRLCGNLGVSDRRFPVRLSDLMVQLGGRPKPWAAVLAAISNGELAAALTPGKGPIAERIRLPDDVDLKAPAFALNSGMDWADVPVSKRECADILGLSPTNFSRYSDFLLGPGKPFRDIRMVDAVILAKRYIGTTEIAKRLKLHHVAALNLAMQRGVKFADKGLFDRESAQARIPEMGRTKESLIRGMKQASSPQRNRGREMDMRAKVAADGRIRIPALVYQQLGLKAGDTVYFELTKHGAALRTAGQAVAQAQALAEFHTGDVEGSGVEGFLERRREDSGE